MKRILFFLIIILSFSLSAENKVTFTAGKNKVSAIIDINPDEYIIFNEQFLFLNVVSAHYSYRFSGFPEGEVQENGDIYYSGKLELEGDLSLKDGVSPGEYDIEVILGYQTCDKEGYCNIPVEVSQSITVLNSGFLDFKIIIAFSIILLCMTLIVLIRRKRS